MQLALLRRRLPRCRCECHPTKETGARRWRGGCAFLHAAPDASPDTAPDSALDAAIDAARCATGAALATSVVGVFYYTPGSDEHGPRFLTGGPGAAPGGGFEERVGVYARTEGGHFL